MRTGASKKLLPIMANCSNPMTERFSKFLKDNSLPNGTVLDKKIFEAIIFCSKTLNFYQ